MTIFRIKPAAIAALAAALSMAAFSAVLADIKDYEFQLVQTDVKQGDGAIVAVRLVDTHHIRLYFFEYKETWSE